MIKSKSKAFQVICKYYGTKQKKDKWEFVKNAHIKTEKHPEPIMAENSHQAIIFCIETHYSKLDGFIFKDDKTEILRELESMISRGEKPKFLPVIHEFLEIETGRRFTLKFSAETMSESEKNEAIDAPTLFDLSLYGGGAAGYEHES
jgi:hypothetical protein